MSTECVAHQVRAQPFQWAVGVARPLRRGLHHLLLSSWGGLPTANSSDL